VIHLQVIDAFGERHINLFFALYLTSTSETYSLDLETHVTDLGIPAAILRNGLIPCAPFTPTLAITVRVLELYRVTQLRCPHLAIQPFVKALCDLHGIVFRPYLSQQFSICYDLYLQIREEVKLRVDAALNRNSDNWRLRNACPACTYKLRDEVDLIIKMLAAMDGNDSLKRILRRDIVDLPDDDDSRTPKVGPSKERPDSRKVGGDYYLARGHVDEWAKAALVKLVPLVVDPAMDEAEKNLCEGRWKNMINEITARMWGIFDETGIFLALCRHGFVLVVADMVRSGELYVSSFFSTHGHLLTE